MGFFLILLWRFSDVILHWGYFSSDLGDNIQAQLPFYSHLIESLQKTRSLDAWNPDVWGGMPGIGNPNIPLNPVLYGLMLLGKPGFIVGMNFHLFLEFFLAAIGMYFLLRIWVPDRWICFISALTYVFSTSAIITSMWYATFFQFVVIPWSLLIIFTLKRRSFFLSVLALSSLFYYQITYGQLQMTIYSWEFILLGFLWWGRDFVSPRQGMILFCTALIVSVILSLHFLLPVLDYLHTNPARQDFSLGQNPVAAQYLLNLFTPRLFWSGRIEGFIKPEEIGWWPTWGDGWSLLESFVVYCGLLPFCLWLFAAVFPHGCYVGRKNGLLLQNLLIFSLILIVLNIWPFANQALCILSLFAKIPYGRSTHFLLFPIIIVASISFFTISQNRKTLFQFTLFLFIITGLVFLFSTQEFYNFFISGFSATSNGLFTHFHQILRQCALSLFAGSLICLVWWLCFNKRKIALILCTFIPALSLSELIGYHEQVSPQGRSSYPFSDIFHPQNPIQKYLKENLNPQLEYIYNMEESGTTSGLTPNLNGLLGIPSWNGYTSVVPRKIITRDMMRIDAGKLYGEGYLRLLGIKYLIVPESLVAIIKETYHDPLTSLIEWNGLTLFRYEGHGEKYFFPQKIARKGDENEILAKIDEASFDPALVSYSLQTYADDSKSNIYSPADCNPKFHLLAAMSGETSVAVENTCKNSVIFAGHIPLHHWWSVRVNDRQEELITLNALHGGVRVPPGNSVIRMIMYPKSVIYGHYLSLVALCILIVVVICYVRYNTNKHQAVLLRSTQEPQTSREDLRDTKC